MFLRKYVAGSVAPFIVGRRRDYRLLFSCLDSLIAQHKLPAIIAISIGNGSGDAQGSERGLEYDTMSGASMPSLWRTEVCPGSAQAHAKLTKDPDGRATMGGSSGGSCALIMAWYHPELYHRVLTYSATFINQQWPSNRKTRMGPGISRASYSQQSGQAAAHLDGSGRPRPFQPERDARQHA